MMLLAIRKFLSPIAKRYYIVRKSVPRSVLANKYIKGLGIEIGALHNPLWLRSHINVKYVDRMSREDLIAEYPELNGLDLVSPDIIDNGEELLAIPADSVDFIIANHFIEHCEDPIKTIINFTSKLKENGVLYLAVPDKEYTFDRLRESTSIEHLIQDYEKGPELSRENHFVDFVSNENRINKRANDNVKEQATQLMNDAYSIHFHVWTGAEFKQFLAAIIQKYSLPIILREQKHVLDESIFILQKTDQHSVRSLL